MEVSPLSSEVTISIHSITEWPSLFPSSSTLCAVSFPYGRVNIYMEHNGLTQLIDEEKRSGEVGVCRPMRALGVATGCLPVRYVCLVGWPFLIQLQTPQGT